MSEGPPPLSLLQAEIEGPPGLPSPPPPISFRTLMGRPRWIKFEERPYEAQAARGDTEARRAGLRYEARVQAALRNQFPGYFMCPYLEFMDLSGWRRGIPDGVLEFPTHGVVFEIKIRTMPEAWWQAERLYAPVLRELWRKPIQSVLISRSSDPAVRMPGPVARIDDLQKWVTEPEYRLQVGEFQWKL